MSCIERDKLLISDPILKIYELLTFRAVFYIIIRYGYNRVKLRQYACYQPLPENGVIVR